MLGMAQLPVKVSASDRLFAGTKIDENGNVSFDVPNTPAEAVGTGATDAAEQGNRVFSVLRVLTNGIYGIATITLVGIFAYKAFNLMRLSDNPNERKKCIQEMGYCILGIVLIGGLKFFTGLFFNMGASI